VYHLKCGNSGGMTGEGMTEIYLAPICLSQQPFVHLRVLHNRGRVTNHAFTCISKGVSNSGLSLRQGIESVDVVDPWCFAVPTYQGLMPRIMHNQSQLLWAGHHWYVHQCVSRYSNWKGVGLLLHVEGISRLCFGVKYVMAPKMRVNRRAVVRIPGLGSESVEGFDAVISSEEL
jgi:hypothetical protein